MPVLTWVGDMSVQRANWQYEFSQYANLLPETTSVAIVMHAFYAAMRKQVSGIIFKIHAFICFCPRRRRTGRRQKNKLNREKGMIKEI